MSSLRVRLADLGDSIGKTAAWRLRRLREEFRSIGSRRAPRLAAASPGRIAMVSGYVTKTPPIGYGGVERSFYYQARDLAQRGWDVHLWGDFQDPASGLYEGITLHPQRDFEGYDILRLDPDVLYQAYPDSWRTERLLKRCRCAIVNEYNAPPSLPPHSDKIYVRCLNRLFYDLAISKGYSPEQLICVPYFQSDETSYRPAVPREDWMLWIGRADPCKALEEAFVFSTLTGVPLRVACRMPNIEVEGYARALWSLMPPTVTYIGEIDRDRKADLFSRCKGLLYTAHPSWYEAFGLIFLDALASGTPVLALDHNSGSTQSAFFPGPPYGLRAPTSRELADLYLRHGDQLRPEAVAARYQEIYGEQKVEKSLDAALRALVRRQGSRSS
jgi:glycosyltransferase involved in cell wall biosynthesis